MRSNDQVLVKYIYFDVDAINEWKNTSKTYDAYDSLTIIIQSQTWMTYLLLMNTYFLSVTQWLPTKKIEWRTVTNGCWQFHLWNVLITCFRWAKTWIVLCMPGCVWMCMPSSVTFRDLIEITYQNLFKKLNDLRTLIIICRCHCCRAHFNNSKPPHNLESIW